MKNDSSINEDRVESNVKCIIFLAHSRPARNANDVQCLLKTDPEASCYITIEDHRMQNKMQLQQATRIFIASYGNIYQVGRELNSTKSENGSNHKLYYKFNIKGIQ